MTKLTILDLGDDLLVTVIPQFLSPTEIFNLSILNRDVYNRFYHLALLLALYMLLYNKMFTNHDNKYQLNRGLTWEQLFRTRTLDRQKVFTWGQGEFGRLGVKIADAPYGVRQGQCLTRPLNLPNFDHHIIVDLLATGFSFVVLTSEGEMFYTGHKWYSPNPWHAHHNPGPPAEDFMPPVGGLRPQVDSAGGRGHFVQVPVRFQRHMRPDNPTFDPPSGRRRLPNPSLERPLLELGIDARNLRALRDRHLPGHRVDPPDLADQRPDPLQDLGEGEPIRPPSPPASEEEPQRPQSPPPPRNPVETSAFVLKFALPEAAHLILVVCGREHVVALDDANRVWQWDNGLGGAMGVQLGFDGQGYVEKIRAGWNLGAYYSYEEGIRVWYSRDALRHDQVSSHDYRVRAHLKLVANTAGDIEDFAVGVDCVLFIRKLTGKLYRCQVPAVELTNHPDTELDRDEPVAAFNEWLDQLNATEDKRAGFSRLNCTYQSFVTFTDDDHVLTGSLNHLDRVEAIPCLQYQQIKLVAIGDYHYLALTTDGKCLAWGVQLQSNGALGLGPDAEMLAAHPEDARREGRDIRVTKPLEVSPPNTVGDGVWVQIAASGWHLGGIYVASNAG